MAKSKPIFDAEVKSWSGLYGAGSGGRKRYAIFQRQAQERARNRMELCLKLLDMDPESAVLDLGCGSGSLNPGVVESGSYWVGTDVSLKMLVHGKRSGSKSNGGRTAWVNASAFELPFKAESFNSIACLGMVNFYRKDKLPEILREMSRVIKPRGTLVITSLRLDLLTWMRSRIYPAIPPPLSCPGPIFPIHYRRFLGLLSDTPFSCTRRVHVRKYLGLPHYTLFKLTKRCQ